MRHICKMYKLEIRAVTKYFCNKGMPLKEVRKDVMESLGKEDPSYSTVKKWAADLRWEEGGVEDDGRYDRPKYAITDVNVMVMHTMPI